MYSDPKLSIKHDIKIIHNDVFGTVQVFKNIYHIFFDKKTVFSNIVHIMKYWLLIIQ